MGKKELKIRNPITDVQKAALKAFSEYSEICMEPNYYPAENDSDFCDRLLSKYYIANWSMYIFWENTSSTCSFEDALRELFETGTAADYRVGIFTGVSNRVIHLYLFTRDLKGYDYSAILFENGWVPDVKNKKLVYDPDKYKKIREMAAHKDSTRYNDPKAQENHEQYVEMRKQALNKKAARICNLMLSGIVLLLVTIFILFPNIMTHIIPLKLHSKYSGSIINIIGLIPGIYLFQRFFNPMYAKTLAKALIQNEVLNYDLPGSTRKK